MQDYCHGGERSVDSAEVYPTGASIIRYMLTTYRNRTVGSYPLLVILLADDKWRNLVTVGDASVGGIFL